ncbi:MAG: hypothetical protein JWP80_2756 [Pseudomonas sp.]|nr:hypothetical protein [Pseudomonas sp.]
MIIDDLVIPDPIKVQLTRLLCHIERAESVAQAIRASARAEGFALGLETLNALRLGDVENLYLTFEQAREARIKMLTRCAKPEMTRL